MTEWNEAEWLERIKAAKDMTEVLEIMREHPPSPYASLLTDDPMSTFTVLKIMEDRS